MGVEIRQHLRRSGVSGQLHLRPGVDVDSETDHLHEPNDPRARLEALLRSAERGARAVLNSMYAADARIVLALCRRARRSCFGDYVTPVEAAFSAAALAEKFERLKASLLLGRVDIALDDTVEDRREPIRACKDGTSQLAAERHFYRQRFVHYAARFPELSNRALRRLATIDAKDAGWPLRPDSRYAKWTLDLSSARRQSRAKVARTGSAQ